MNNKTPFLPIELQNIIMSYTRPVYPYIKQLKRYKKHSEDKERYKNFSDFYFNVFF